MGCSPKRGGGALVAGLVFIGIGAILLLNQLGFFPRGFPLRFWPVLLVAIGLIKLFAGPGRGDQALGVAFILAGTIVETNSMGLTHITWSQAWPLLLIAAGVLMVMHSWSDKSGGNLKFTTDPEMNSFYVFGGGERQVNARDFRGAKLFAMFGGYEVDLTRADMAGNDAYIEANAIFGGGEIRVPPTWKVVVEGVGVFGGYDDKTQYVQADPNAPSKTLHIRGVAVFGGIEVRN